MSDQILLAAPSETPAPLVESIDPEAELSVIEAPAGIETRTASETSHSEVLLDGAAPAGSALPARRPSSGWGLASIAAISFSLTFVVGGIALLAGLLPRSMTAGQVMDLGVLLLMVPVCALVLTMLAEVMRAALSGLPRIQPPRLSPALSDWRPGRGEG